MKHKLYQVIARLLLICLLFTYFTPTNIAEAATTTTYEAAIASGDLTTYYSELKSEVNALGITSTTTKEEMQSILTSNKDDIARLEMITACGLSTLNTFTAASSNNKAFLTWLFGNTEAMNKYLTSGAPRNNKIANALTIWEELYRTDTESRSGLYLTLAIAVSLEHADSVDTSWYCVNSSNVGYVVNPISRYNNFKAAHKAGKLYSVFDTLNVTKMRLVVDAWLKDTDLDWARTTYSGPHSYTTDDEVVKNITKVYDRSNIATAGLELDYSLTNAAGASVHGKMVDYYGADATLAKVLSVGAVCGGIAKYGANMAKAFGVPAFPVAQPGHAACLYNNEDGVWSYHYNIFGVGESFSHDGVIYPWAPSTAPKGARYVTSEGTTDPNKSFGPAYVLLYEAAYVADTTLDKSEIDQSEILRLLAKDITDYTKAQNIRRLAMSVCKDNIQVWRDYITALKTDASFTNWNSLKDEIINNFANQPRPMTELLTSIEAKLITATSTDSEKEAYVTQVWNTYEAVTGAAITGPQQQGVRDIIERSMEPWKYDYLPVPNITFSFSGDNEEKLMGFSKGMTYSIDGGKTFLAPSDTNYKFKINEINSMSAANGILVRNKYSTTTDKSKMAVFNITANTGGDISVTGDDVTNTISGLESGMQYSTNNGVTWTTYTGSNAPDVTDNMTLLVRRPGDTLMMPSKATELIYTCPLNIAYKKSTTAGAGSDNKGPVDAPRTVDGNLGTTFLINTATPENKYIFVDLGSVQNVNGVKLKWSTTQYGYASEYKISVSNDTKSWTDVYTTTTGNGGSDYISLEPVMARYVRLSFTTVVRNPGGTYAIANLAEFEVYDGTSVPTVWDQTDVTYLSDIAWSSCDKNVGLDATYNSSGYTSPKLIALDGVQYKKGLGTLPSSMIQYDLGGNYTTFNADIGIDDIVTSSNSVIFTVIKDATTIFTSDPISATSPVQHISLDVTGANMLTLNVTASSGNAEADWANAYLTTATDNGNPNFTSVEPNGTGISQDTQNVILHFDETVTAVSGKKVVLASNDVGYYANATDATISGDGSSCIVTIPINRFKKLNGDILSLKSGNFYSLLMEKGAFIDAENNPSEAVYSGMEFRIKYGPRITGIIPNDSEVSTETANLVLAFDSSVKVGVGSKVMISLDGVEYTTVPLASQISGTGNECKAMIPFSSFKDTSGNTFTLTGGKLYTVSVEEGAFADEVSTRNNACGGFVFATAINVSADDINNTIIGINTSMEFSINGGTTWTKYNGSNLPVLSGNTSIKVRRAAIANLSAGTAVQLFFTDGVSTNPMVGVVSNVTYLGTGITVTQTSNGWGKFETDLSNGESGSGDGRNININGVTYTKGLGCHATSVLYCNPAGMYTRFVSDIGADNETNGTVKFEVWASADSTLSEDDTCLFSSSSVMTKTTPAQHVDVDITGVTYLILKINDGGNGTAGDHADWAGAYLVKPVSYTVTFDPQNGTAVTTSSAISGSAITAITPPTKTGYIFGGWYKEAGCTTEWNFTSDTVTADTTLYAKWTTEVVIPVSYTVTFNAQNGTTDATVSVVSGSAITAITPPTKTGYIFGGWYKEAGCTTEWNFTSDTVTSDITLYAKWTAEEYVITYSLNGGNNNVSNKTTYTYGLGLSLAAPTREDYTFAGWYDNSGFMGSAITGYSTTDTGAKTVYAKWIEVNNNVTPTVPGISVVPQDTTTTTRQGGVIQVNDSDTNAVVTVDVVRNTTADKKVDTVNLDQNTTKEVVQKLVEQNKEVVQVLINDIPNNSADEVNISIHKDAVQELATNKVALEVSTEYVSVTLPKETIQNVNNTKNDLYFQIIPIINASQKAVEIQNAITAEVVQATAGSSDVVALGTPMMIETNYQDFTTMVTFSLKGITIPTDTKLRQRFLDSLAVFIKHSDGTKELSRGTIKYDESGNPVGLEIEVSKFSTFTIISISNEAPIVSKLKLTGIAKMGNKLSVTFSYQDADQDEQEVSIIKWYRADDKNGKKKVLISKGFKSSYTITEKDKGHYIIVEVTPVAKTGVLTGKTVSEYINVINKKPKAVSVKVKGILTVGSKLTASYKYSDTDKDLEGKSIYQWYRADYASGNHMHAITGAKKRTYTLTKNDIGKYIIFKIVPVAKTGKLKGTSVTVFNKDKVAQYNCHVKLRLIGNKTYANSVASLFEKNVKCNTTIRKEGISYRVYIDFKNLSEAKSACKDMIKKGYISSYSFIE